MEEFAEMAFEFVCDYDQCLNCGACMDLCPPRCLDMTRPTAGAEGHLDQEGRRQAALCFPCCAALSHR